MDLTVYASKNVFRHLDAKLEQNLGGFATIGLLEGSKSGRNNGIMDLD